LNAAGVFFTSGNFAVFNFPLDPDFETSRRAWIGWQRGDGLGVRARYWEFDHAFIAPATIPPWTSTFQVVVLGLRHPNVANVFHNWDAYTVDLEVFDTTNLNGLEVTWSAGIRYVEYEEVRGFSQSFAIGAATVATMKQFSGIGLTAGLEVRRAVTTNIGVFASSRFSTAMGDEDNLIAITAAFPALGANIAATIEERQ
jgi:hypothetical protein